VPVTSAPEAHDPSSAVGSPATWQFYLGSLVVIALVLASYVVGVLLPYAVNDLHRLPLAEVASGAHDPKDMWPQGSSAVPGLMQLAGLFAVTLGPLVVLGVLLAVPWALWDGRGRTSRNARVIGFVTTALALVLVSLLVSPLGQALTTWRLD